MKWNLKSGEIYETNNFGPIEILQEAITISFDNKKPTDKYYLIRFINTGYTKFASASAIMNGSVKDNIVPFIANIGYIGSDIKISSNPIIFMFYKVWNDMINRCYNKLDRDYPLYGGLGITVEKRWFNFSNFLIDIRHLPNYIKKIKYPNIYQFDKDYLQFHIPKSQRIYSRLTCMWLSKYDNITIMNREYTNSTGYYGVYYKDHSYNVKINNITYGRFNSPDIAAAFYNIIYLKYFRHPEFSDICIINEVPKFSPQEISQHCVNKQRWFINSSNDIEII